MRLPKRPRHLHQIQNLTGGPSVAETARRWDNQADPVAAETEGRQKALPLRESPMEDITELPACAVRSVRGTSTGTASRTSNYFWKLWRLAGMETSSGP